MKLLNYSEAADSNKEPILKVLQQYICSDSTVFEIGSGSGQHALYFVDQLSGLHWQSSDTDPYFDGLSQNLSDVSSRLLTPQRHDLNQDKLPGSNYDVLYAANVLHIVEERLVAVLVQQAGKLVGEGGYLMLYGPFKYNGEFTSGSNADFDHWLKQQNPKRGIRDFEWIEELARQEGFVLLQDHKMPANNQMLVFTR